MKNQFKHLISLSCLGSLLLGVSQFALAHGYTTEPPSRAYLCSVRNTTELKIRAVAIKYLMTHIVLKHQKDS